MAAWATHACADIGALSDDEDSESVELSPHAALDLGDEAYGPKMYESADFAELEQVGGRDPVPIFNASSTWRRHVSSVKVATNEGGGGRRGGDGERSRASPDMFHFMSEEDSEEEAAGEGREAPAPQSAEAMMRLMMCVGGEEGKTYDEIVSAGGVYRPCELTPADALYDEIEELQEPQHPPPAAHRRPASQARFEPLLPPAALSGGVKWSARAFSLSPGLPGSDVN